MASPGSPPPSGAAGLFRRMRQGVRYAAYGAAALIATSAAVSMYRTAKRNQAYLTLPPAFVLEMDLERVSVVERVTTGSLPQMLAQARLQQMELGQLTHVLEKAKQDERVWGVLALLGPRTNFQGWGQACELRSAFQDFVTQARNKKLYVFTPTFGDPASSGLLPYYVASAASRVFVQPDSHVMLDLPTVTQIFVRGLLDRLNVRAWVFKRKEYKNAFDPVKERAFTPAHREGLRAWLDDLAATVTADVAAARSLSTDKVRAAMLESPLTAARAVTLGLIDGARWRDQVETELRVGALWVAQQHSAQALRAKGIDVQPLQLPKPQERSQAQKASGLPRVSLERYLDVLSLEAQLEEPEVGRLEKLFGGGSKGATKEAGSGARAGDGQEGPRSSTVEESKEAEGSSADSSGAASSSDKGGAVAERGSGGRRPVVAVVWLAGPITSGGGAQPGMVDATSVSRLLRRMRESQVVRAVVVRINSPGGSVIASDTLFRELQAIRQHGKPVVVSMGDVAASGGYLAALPANVVFAQPGTLTGSIGVVGVQANVSDALASVGVTHDTATATDAPAPGISALHDPTPDQIAQMDTMLDETYASFTGKVAQCRQLTTEQVAALAGGRVWTGVQAQRLGLVDQLGGLQAALQAAKVLAQLPPEPGQVLLAQYPPRPPPFVMRILRGLSRELDRAWDRDEVVPESAKAIAADLGASWLQQVLLPWLFGERVAAGGSGSSSLFGRGQSMGQLQPLAAQVDSQIAFLAGQQGVQAVCLEADALVSS